MQFRQKVSLCRRVETLLSIDVTCENILRAVYVVFQLPEKNKENVSVKKDLDSFGLKELKAYLPSKRSQEQNQVNHELYFLGFVTIADSICKLTSASVNLVV